MRIPTGTHRLVLPLAFLLAAIADAAEPRIVGSVDSDDSTIRVKQNEPPWVSLSVEDVPDGAIRTWAGPIGAGKVGFTFGGAGKENVGIATGLPGTYQFRVIVQVPKDGPDDISVYESTVIVEGTGPTPVPVPVEDFATTLANAVKAAKPEALADIERAASVYELFASMCGSLSSGKQVIELTDASLSLLKGFADIKKTVVDPHVASLKDGKAADCEPVYRQIAAAIKAGLVDIPPPPDVDPLPVSSLHVLIVEEMDERASLPASQVGIFTSTELRKWFEDNDVQWRIFDKDVNLEHAEKKWQDAMKRERASLPWVIVSNGRTGWEGPLPKDTASLIQLLEQYR